MDKQTVIELAGEDGEVTERTSFWVILWNHRGIDYNELKKFAQYSSFSGINIIDDQLAILFLKD